MVYQVSNPFHEASEAIESPPRKRLPEEFLRDERPRAGAEAGSRMGARADVVEAVHGCPVARKLGPRTPDEILVEGAGAAVDVASDQVHVPCLDVRGREHDPLQDGRVEIFDL